MNENLILFGMLILSFLLIFGVDEFKLWRQRKRDDVEEMACRLRGEKFIPERYRYRG